MDRYALLACLVKSAVVAGMEEFAMNGFKYSASTCALAIEQIITCMQFAHETLVEAEDLRRDGIIVDCASVETFKQCAADALLVL